MKILDGLKKKQISGNAPGIFLVDFEIQYTAFPAFIIKFSNTTNVIELYLPQKQPIAALSSHSSIIIVMLEQPPYSPNTRQNRNILQCNPSIAFYLYPAQSIEIILLKRMYLCLLGNLRRILAFWSSSVQNEGTSTSKIPGSCCSGSNLGGLMGLLIGCPYFVNIYR